MATASVRRRAAGWWRARRERRGRRRLSQAHLHQALALGGWAVVLFALAWLIAARVYGLVNA